MTRTDADGRFTFDGLNEGTINIYVSDNEVGFLDRIDARLDLSRRPGRRAEVGLDESGDDRADPRRRGRGEGRHEGQASPSRGRTSASRALCGLGAGRRSWAPRRTPRGATATGCRLARPIFYVMGHPPGQADRTVVIPEGVARFEVPPIVMGHILIGARAGHRCRRRAGLGGDGRGTRRDRPPIRPGVDAVTDSRGEFQFPGSPNNSVPIGQAARLLIRLRDGSVARRRPSRRPTARSRSSSPSRPDHHARPRRRRARDGLTRKSSSPSMCCCGTTRS